MTPVLAALKQTPKTEDEEDVHTTIGNKPVSRKALNRKKQKEARQKEMHLRQAAGPVYVVREVQYVFCACSANLRLCHCRICPHSQPGSTIFSHAMAVLPLGAVVADAKEWVTNLALDRCVSKRRRHCSLCKVFDLLDWTKFVGHGRASSGDSYYTMSL